MQKMGKIVFFTFLWVLSVFGCTDFVIDAQDGSYVNGRSLEFGKELQASIQVSARKQNRTSTAPNQTQGLSWVSKYGYVGVRALGMNFPFDGMNEAGLSFGYLWLPNITEYPTVSSQNMNRALDFVDLCDWILSNFETVAQVKEALKTVFIWGHPVPPLGMAPVHAAIHDAKGNHLVIEFVGGSMQVYDNPTTILTNAPAFPWHTTNLQNYLNLNAVNPNGITFKGMKIDVPGQGGGFLGIPGDSSPPSRFVKMFTFMRYAKKVATNLDAVNLAEHFLNSVDIPMGEIRESANSDAGDYTQWVVIKDMTQKVFYFRSYGDLVLKKIDMKRLNFLKNQDGTLSINIKKGYVDVTDSLGNQRAMTVNRLPDPQSDTFDSSDLPNGLH